MKRAGPLGTAVLVVTLGILLLPTGALSRSTKTPVYGYKVIHTFPHDHEAFTQGLIYLDGFLYEGTGIKGKSSVRMVDLESGRVLQKHDIPPQYFGEGLTNWGSTLVELTWQSETGFVYDRFSLRPQKSFQYKGEGWGLTQDGKQLILSDGSANLRYLDPQSFREVRQVQVTDEGSPVDNLNELEWVRGEIYANIWQKDRIARIAPTTGKVVGWIDLAGILPDTDRTEQVDVLNGIAYDAKRDRLFVTGKLWPKLFEIKLVPKS